MHFLKLVTSLPNSISNWQGWHSAFLSCHCKWPRALPLLFPLPALTSHPIMWHRVMSYTVFSPPRLISGVVCFEFRVRENARQRWLLGKTSKYPTKDNKRWQKLAGEIIKSGILLIWSGLTKVAYSLQKDIKVHRKQQLDVITQGDL